MSIDQLYNQFLSLVLQKCTMYINIFPPMHKDQNIYDYSERNFFVKPLYIIYIYFVFFSQLCTFYPSINSFFGIVSTSKCEGQELSSLRGHFGVQFSSHRLTKAWHYLERRLTNKFLLKTSFQIWHSKLN